MSIRSLAWALDQKCPSPAAKLVLIKLADYSNDEGECWPSQGRIARDCGIGRTTINYHIQKLIKSGLVTASGRCKDDGGQTSNLYHLAMTPLSIPSTPPVDPIDTPPVYERDTPLSIPSTRTFHLEPLDKKDSVSLRSTAADAASGDPVKAIFDRGLVILGANRRSLLGKMRQQYGDPAVLAAIAACEAELPSEPASFLVACLQASSKPRKQSPVEKLYEGAYLAALEYDEKHGISRDRSPDQPAPVPLLDRRRSSSRS